VTRVTCVTSTRKLTVTDYTDATRTLHEYACWCATRALDREEAAGRPANPRSRDRDCHQTAMAGRSGH